MQAVVRVRGGLDRAAHGALATAADGQWHQCHSRRLAELPENPFHGRCRGINVDKNVEDMEYKGKETNLFMAELRWVFMAGGGDGEASCAHTGRYGLLQGLDSNMRQLCMRGIGERLMGHGEFWGNSEGRPWR
jgi:hypothetical protein